MYILALETTGEHASAAIIDEKGSVVENLSTGVLNHLQNITVMIGDLVEKCQLTLDDIQVIAASEGPGSFTGIRIGVSTARALAQALGKETLGVPTLETFIYNAGDFDGFICPIFDARREQIYGGVYRKPVTGKGRPEEIVAGGAYDISDFLEALSHRLKQESEAGFQIMLFGDGIKKYGERFELWSEEMKSWGLTVTVVTAAEDCRFQRAAFTARLALEIYKDAGGMHFEKLKPNYMRKAEAERKLEEGSLAMRQL